MSAGELGTVHWFKSSRSANNGSCVECAFLARPSVAVRDSKDPGGPVLVFGPVAWTTFLTSVKQR